MKVLVTGGARSGKSSHAESLLADRPTVRYVAPGPTRDDADWAVRIAAHQARRPTSWTTVETHDLAAALATDDPVLVDCLGTWLTAVVDDAGLWEAPAGVVFELVEERVAAALGVLGGHPDSDPDRDPDRDWVLVTNEVGLGVVPEHRSGRLFRDLLGTVNQRFAAVCDEVHLVVAGRVLRL
jgi:adenosylcobinamide kinase/adenosylcobinamide-phosphate guanylyltransferase